MQCPWASLRVVRGEGSDKQSLVQLTLKQCGVRGTDTPQVKNPQIAFT